GCVLEHDPRTAVCASALTVSRVALPVAIVRTVVWADSPHTPALPRWVDTSQGRIVGSQMANKPRDSRWHAVSIVSSSQSCEAARALKERRFLSRDAPRLPLPDCAQAEHCRCSYRKYADRRAGPRRDEEQLGGRRTPDGGAERRAGRGRRRTDG